MSNTDQHQVARTVTGRVESRLDPAHLAQSAEKGPSLVRQDAAHPQVATAGVTTPGPASSAAAFVEQVQTQAAQLADHLQRQRDNLEHREAELNARTAAVENQVRHGRLCLDEQQQEIETREAEIDRREETFREYLSRLGLDVQDGAIVDVQGELTRQVSVLGQRDTELKDRQRTLADQRTRVRQQTAQLDVRRRYLDNAEALLAKQREGTAAIRRQLELERTQLEQQRQEQDEQLTGEQRLAENDLGRQRKRLEDRCVEIEKREAALERLHAELMESQREIIEVRLATEEIWSELSGTMSPAVLTRSIAQIRTKLADQYSLAKVDMARREDQLQELARQLVERHDRLEEQKIELNDWVARRQEEIGRQAARVVACQRELDRRRARDNQERLKWQEERLGYQQEVRQLLARLQQLEPAAA